MNKYDLGKRLSIVFGELSKPGELGGKTLLDLGCGTGWFSKRAMEAGADVYSVDIGFNLLKKVAEKCNSKKIVSDGASLGIKDGVFDLVIATESIEHTFDPKAVLGEIHRVLKDGGILISNKSLIGDFNKPKGIKTVNIQMTDIASKLGDIRCANMIAIGAIAKYSSVVSIKNVTGALKAMFKGKEDLFLLNKKAIEKGYGT